MHYIISFSFNNTTNATYLLFKPRFFFSSIQSVSRKLLILIPEVIPNFLYHQIMILFQKI